MKQFFYAFIFIFFCSGIKGFAGDLMYKYDEHLPSQSPEQSFFFPQFSALIKGAYFLGSQKEKQFQW